MRIPTGGKILTITASRNSLFGFTCAYCGKKAIEPYKISQEAKGEYHVLNSAETKNRVTNQTESKASGLLAEMDKTLFENVNHLHKYHCVNGSVVCPHCHAKQPWSGFPKAWTRQQYVPWALGMAALTILTIFTIRNSLNGIAVGFFGFLVILGFFVVGSLPIINYFKLDRARKKCDNTPFVPPVYYNQSNRDALIAAAIELENEKQNLS